MSWCLLFSALLAALLGCAALLAQPGPVHPGALLRGCVSAVFLFGALGLGGLALLASGWQP